MFRLKDTYWFFVSCLNLTCMIYETDYETLSESSLVDVSTTNQVDAYCKQRK